VINRLLFIQIVIVFILISCSQVPEIAVDEISDLSYHELKQKYITCNGRGVMSAKGDKPWKLNYSFSTQNDSSFIQFRDIIGRRILFVHSLPNEITLWDMQKNLQYNSDIGNSIPIFDIIESYDIAQILWGEIPNRYDNINKESGFERDSNLVNFESTTTQLGMVLDKVIFNLDSHRTIVEFKISAREYGKSIPKLVSGIPEHIPSN